MLKTFKKFFLVALTLFAAIALVACGGGSAKEEAQKVLDEFTQNVTFANTTEVTTSFQLAIKGKKSGYEIPITWESSNPDVIAIADLMENGAVSTTFKTAKVTRPEKGAGNANVTLTATFTITYDETKTLTAKKEFTFTVLEEVSAIERGTLATIKEAAAKFYFEENGVKPGSSSSDLEYPVEFDATVTAVCAASGAGQFMVSDGTAGIYVYSNKVAVKVGDEVHVKGSITVYYGVLQVGSNIEVTVTDIEDQNIVYTDEVSIQELHEQSISDGMYGGQTLKLYGKLVYGKYNANDSDSYWLEDPTTGAQVLVYYKSYSAEEDEMLQGYVGKYVTMNAATYDKYSTYKPYNSRVIAVASSIAEASAPTLTDEEKVEQTVNKVKAVTLEKAYYNGSEFAFPNVNPAEGVTVEWALNPASVLVNGKFVVTADTTATLTATIKCGSIEEKVELTLNLKTEVKTITIAEALKLEDGTDVIVKGTVIEINTPWSDTYGNITVTIQDETGTLYCYRTKLNVKVGDVVKLTGKMGSYNGAKQLAAGSTGEIVGKEEVKEEEGKKVTIAEALKLEDGVKVVVKGTVSEINTPWSDSYGNITVTIKDETGELYCYRLATNVKVGDVVTVTGKMGSYNGAKQLAAGATAVIEGGNTGGETPAPADPVEVSIAKANELPDGTKVIVTGTVVKVNIEWSDQYNNLSVTIADATGGLYVYRLGTKVVVGDVIKVTGSMTTYNGLRQVAQGATAEIIKTEVSDEVDTDLVSVKYALKQEDGTTISLQGKVIEINTAWSDYYGNMSVTIADISGELYCYRLATKVELDDYIIVTGEMATYKGARQLAAGATAEIVKDPVNPVETTIKDALTLEDETPVILTGVVSEIKTEYSEQYKNISVTLTDETGSLYLFRLAGKVALGDTIKVTGEMATYKEERQLAAGATYELIASAPKEEIEIPADAISLSIRGANKLADGTKVAIQATVTEINTPWNETYGNMSVTVSDISGSLYCYRLATKVEVGQLVIVVGEMATYKEARQLAAGAVAYVVVDVEKEEETPSTPAGTIKIAEALKLEDGASIVVKGTVSEINTPWSDKYGNITVTIKDETGELYCYRLATNVKVGDVVTVTGKMGTYNNARQVAAGATAVIESGNTGGSTGGETPATKSATITFNDLSKRTQISDEAQVWEENGIKVSNNRNGAKAAVNGKYYNPARFYAGSQVVVESTKAFTKVVITTNNKHFKSLDITGATVTIDGSTTTIEFASSATSFTIDELAAQVRVDKIEVFYAE
ncbi:MAG: hypothetical protein IJX78_04215 [Bacilli bacterium]|nr:hypothetical protein [Bacilli bacterium]